MPSSDEGIPSSYNFFLTTFDEFPVQQLIVYFLCLCLSCVCVCLSLSLNSAFNQFDDVIVSCSGEADNSR